MIPVYKKKILSLNGISVSMLRIFYTMINIDSRRIKREEKWKKKRKTKKREANRTQKE